MVGVGYRVVIAVEFQQHVSAGIEQVEVFGHTPGEDGIVFTFHVSGGERAKEMEAAWDGAGHFSVLESVQERRIKLPDEAVGRVFGLGEIEEIAADAIR